MDREQLIRERAYVIWDAEGRPAGRDQEHWDRAVSEINAQTVEQPVESAVAVVTAQPTPAASEPTPTPSAAEPAAPARAKRAAKGTAKPAAARSPRGKAGKTPA